MRSQINLASSKIKKKTLGSLIGIEHHEHVDPALNESEIWELTKEDWDKF